MKKVFAQKFYSNITKSWSWMYSDEEFSGDTHIGYIVNLKSKNDKNSDMVSDSLNTIIENCIALRFYLNNKLDIPNPTLEIDNILELLYKLEKGLE